MKILEDWTTVRLQEIILDMQPGFAQRPNDSEGIPQLRTNNISPEGTIDLSSLVYVKATSNDLKRYSLQKGDVIFNNTNSIEWVGKTAFFNLEDTYVFSNHMTRIRVNPNLLDAEFLAKHLHYLWQTGLSRRWVKQWVNQAAIDQIGLAQFQIVLPPLPEQRRIVAILREADELRRLRKQADEKAQTLLPALFYEMFGDPIRNERRWNTSTIAGMGRVITGNTPPRDKPEYYGDFIEWIKSDNIDSRDVFATPSKERLSEEGAKKGRIAPKRSTLITCIAGSHDSIGKSAMVDREVAFNQQINAVIPHNKVNPHFLFSVVRLSKALIQALSSKGMKGIVNKTQLEGVSLICPPRGLQKVFARRAVEIIEIIEIQNKAVESFECLFQSLLAQALTGELTAAWREKHKEELSKAAAERDTALTVREKQKTDTKVLIDRALPRLVEFGAALLLEAVHKVMPLKAPLARSAGAPLSSEEYNLALNEIIDLFRGFDKSDRRYYALRELSKQQYRIYQTALKTKGYYIAETLSEKSGLDLTTVRRGLEALASLGLVRPVSLRVDHTELPPFTIVPAYAARQINSEFISAEEDGL